MNTLTDLLLGVGQPRVSHFPDLCTLLYTYLSTLDYWTKIVYYLFTQTSPVAHTSALIPTYIKSQKLPNWPISKELGLGRMLLPHWKLLFVIAVTKTKCIVLQQPCDYFSILMSSIKPLLVALGPGPKLNGYSITYVIHSLRTSCSELEWVWNSADYCRPRHFQEHVVLITNDHLTSLVS